jgi:gentisate 1,2-dioxygenase
MPTFDDAQARLIDRSGRQTSEKKRWRDHDLDMWEPLIVPRLRLEEEIRRLSALPRPHNGVRRTRFVHPRSDERSLGFAPGIDVSLDVLLPGERSQPVRQNSAIVNFCIGGSGSMVVNGGLTSVEYETYDVFTTPSMMVHEYVNDTPDLQVRLRYSNGALLEKLNIHYVDEDPRLDEQGLTPAPRKLKADQLNPFGAFELTSEGAWLVPYEKLVNPDAVVYEPKIWPWKDVKRELDKLAALGPAYRGRRLYMLADPATGRTNGATPNFFATITIRPKGIQDKPHRHSSAAMNYYFGGSGHSFVEGKRYDWEAGDLMFSAPGWATHNHCADSGPVYELTIQDMPFCLNTDALLWQEDLAGPIALLGSRSGFETNRAAVAES